LGNIETTSSTNIQSSHDVDVDLDVEPDTNTNVHETELAKEYLDKSKEVVSIEDVDEEPVTVDHEESINPNPSPILEINEELTEFEIDDDLDNLENHLEPILLKKPNEVYYEMYKEARKRAKKAKKDALLAFLEAKNIKQTYMLDELDSSSDDSDDD